MINGHKFRAFLYLIAAIVLIISTSLKAVSTWHLDFHIIDLQKELDEEKEKAEKEKAKEQERKIDQLIEYANSVAEQKEREQESSTIREN